MSNEIRLSNALYVSNGTLDLDIAKPKTFNIDQAEAKRVAETLTLDAWGTAVQLSFGDITTAGLMSIQNTGDATIYLGQSVTSGGVNAVLVLKAGERYVFRTSPTVEWWASSVGETTLDYQVLGD